MSWHPECYKVEFGVEGKSYRSKFTSKCQAGAKCKVGGYIQQNMPFVYSAYSNPMPKPVATSTGVPVSKTGTLQGENYELALNTVRTIIVEETAKQVKGLVNIDKMSDDIALKVLALMPTAVKFTAANGDVKDTGIVHKQFPILLKTIMARVNVWLAGPSGSGKTTAAMKAAQALSLPFRYTGAVGDPYALIGYNDANGKYVRTPFRDAWEKGGVFLWDEVDASDPNALLAFNAALANGTAPFPDGVIDKHQDCILIAAANTWGHGATHEYVGRLKMDAAFLKRFAFISWDYDDNLELTTAPNREWTLRVQKVRARVKAKGLRVLVTPRESYLGAQLLAAGIPQSEVERMTIKSGMTDDQWAQVGGV